ncbi:hypothetical protein F5B20DRAFT_523079 [Whalleya microplaca]|nr:hypothetical protein F5B20DRAFT_523079 [Whalleya microplaca]
MLDGYNKDIQSIEPVESDHVIRKTTQKWSEKITEYCRAFLSKPLWPILPRYQQDDTQPIPLGSCNIDSRPQQDNHIFMLLCVPFMRWGLKLHNVETSIIYSDQQFFRLLQQCYTFKRRHIFWRKFRKVKALNFVKVRHTEYPMSIVLSGCVQVRGFLE